MLEIRNTKKATSMGIKNSCKKLSRSTRENYRIKKSNKFFPLKIDSKTTSWPLDPMRNQSMKYLKNTIRNWPFSSLKKQKYSIISTKSSNSTMRRIHPKFCPWTWVNLTFQLKNALLLLKLPSNSKNGIQGKPTNAPKFS